ncbi:hypothetical protein [Polynucleobacter necessarius]|uniref:hypothetical protein n=1 Tax=Polynucleobacter necessarius TaxID=576610 RepID=UPI0018D543F0|nr:hypothetical protein [Polynucleobacter necessarius]
MFDPLVSPFNPIFSRAFFNFFICAVLSVFIVGVSKSGFGAGLGILSLPLMASQSSINEALAILLPLLIAIDLVSMRRFLYAMLIGAF